MVEKLSLQLFTVEKLSEIIGGGGGGGTFTAIGIIHKTVGPLSG
jgi:hypothetical protein